MGADVYQIYPHVDAIAHEYEFGGGDDHTAASRTPFDWLMYQIGLRSFRAFAGDRSTWILNYSWDGAPHVKPRDAMLNLAMSELMAGANLWDAKGHVMSGSNDMATRTEIFHWVAAHQAIFSGSARRIGNVGVYFSDTTRNYGPERVHRVLSRHAVAAAAGTYPVPDRHAAHAVRIRRQHAWCFPMCACSATRNPLLCIVFSSREASSSSPAALTRSSTTSRPPSVSRIVRSAVIWNRPAPHFDTVQSLRSAGTAPCHQGSIRRSRLPRPAMLWRTPQRSTARHYIFFANFTGLQAGKVATPAPQSGIRITVPERLGTRMHVLPFLGKESVVSGDIGWTRYDPVSTAASLQRGTVVWFIRNSMAHASPIELFLLGSIEQLQRELDLT